VLPQEDDLPLAAVSDIATILAKGYLCYRASCCKPSLATDCVSTAQTADSRFDLAFQPTQSVHGTVVNTLSKGEKE
jgi:hypothetical protein